MTTPSSSRTTPMMKTKGAMAVPEAGDGVYIAFTAVKILELEESGGDDFIGAFLGPLGKSISAKKLDEAMRGTLFEADGSPSKKTFKDFSLGDRSLVDLVDLIGDALFVAVHGMPMKAYFDAQARQARHADAAPSPESPAEQASSESSKGPLTKPD